MDSINVSDSPVSSPLAGQPTETSDPRRLLDSLRRRTAHVGVIGLGYVGLPLVRALADAGFPVLGFDVDRAKIARLQRGESYIGHIPGEWIGQRIAERRFTPTDDFDQLPRADCIVICVPTPLTEAREPDLSYVTGTAETIARRLRPGQLVVLESTTYPGTTDDVVRGILETSGLVCGRDFHLAYSPEREDPGNAKFRAGNIPKVVGGIDAASLELAVALYEPIVGEVVPVADTRIAEACKLLENTYRAINIALVNELKVLFDRMGIDVWQVIEAAKTKPFGFQAFYPGPGLGGHCIPIDPFYLTWLARKYGMSTRFIELAGEVNTSMPAYVVGKVADALNERGKPVKGSRVAILGMAYKKDVDDPRESPGFELVELLLKKGAQVTYNDPHIPVLPRMRHYPDLHMESRPLTAEYLAVQDCVLIATDHTAYEWEWIVDNSRLVVDTRNATRGVKKNRQRIVYA